MASNTYCIERGLRFFTCEMCNKVFTTHSPIKEVEQEYKDVFKEEPNPDDICSLCDECYKKIMSNPRTIGLCLLNTKNTKEKQ